MKRVIFVNRSPVRLSSACHDISMHHLSSSYVGSVANTLFKHSVCHDVAFNLADGFSNVTNALGGCEVCDIAWNAFDALFLPPGLKF